MKKIFSLATLFAFVLVAAVACSADNYTAEIPTEIYVEIPPQVVKPPPTPTPETPPPPKETHPPDDAPPPEDTPPPKVALTFDDGPSMHTAAILDVLEQYDARATFFVLGNRIPSYRATVKRAVELGSEIANHTHSHPRLTTQTDSQIIREIQYTSAAIKAIAGTSPQIYRPPFGATDERVIKISKELGYGIVKWTLDPLDWRDRDPNTIYDRIMSQVEDGSVIVLHDIHKTTAQAMKRVIPSLIEKGFKLVTVSELLEHRYGGLEAGNIHGSYCAWRIWDN